MNDQALSVGRVIALLGTLAHGWPKNLILFSYKDRLYLLDKRSGKVFWDTTLIVADGSDDVTASVDERGNQTLEW